MHELWQAVQAHAHWMLWCLMLYIMMMETPSPGRLNIDLYSRLKEMCRARALVLLIFGLAGGLGIVLEYRPILELEQTAYLIIPTSVGLLVLPWLLERLCTKQRRVVGLMTAIVMVVVTWHLTGLLGITILVVCSGIGALPLFYQSSRLTLFAFWLLPLALRLSGWDSIVCTWMYGAA